MRHASENYLPTPAMVIDTQIVERNLKTMADYAAQHRLKLRPHTKTHKSIYMARRQIAHGAAGLTVAKVGEAEIMCEASNDLLVAYPALDPYRSSRIAELARQCTMTTAIDSAYAAAALNDAACRAESTIRILVDLDVGFHRTGVQNAQAALALAHHISKLSHLRFDGLFFFPGHLKAPGTDETSRLAMKSVSAFLQETIALLTQSGLEVKTVSGGSTPSAPGSHLIPEITEIRPGTYIYQDWNYISGGQFLIEDCAANIICTVISDAVPNKVVIDAGSKTLTSDRLATDPEHGGFGRLPDYPDARIVRLSEEHGEVDLTRCDRRPKLGERVRVIPNHICPCVNLVDQVWLKSEDGSVNALPVDARGKLN